MVQPYVFWNRLAKRYSKSPIADEGAYQKKLEITRRYFKPEMEVLEFGCGTGSTAIAHAPYVKTIKATDFSVEMINIAKSKAEANGVTNVRFEVVGVDQITVPEESVDVVMGHSILHLLENKDEIIRRVYKMLKPGGVFVSNTACIGDRMKFLKYVAPIGRFFGVLPVLNVFSLPQLEEALIGAGFSIDHQWQPRKNSAVFIVAQK